MGADWAAMRDLAPDDLTHVFERFDARGGDPCVWLHERLQNIVIVTWGTVATDHDTALEQARTTVTTVMAEVGLPGQLVSLSAATEDGQADWRSTDPLEQ